MTDIITHNYNGFIIPQRLVDGYVNLTAMAKAVGKRLDNWFRNQSTKEYLECLAASLDCEVGSIVLINNTGSNEQKGTWSHKLVAIQFAHDINPSFAVWANSHLLELMETGTTSLEILQPTTQPDTIQLMKEAVAGLDVIFSSMDLAPALYAGIKMNAVQEIAPHLAKYIEPARQYLINATANENKLITVTELGKLLNPPLSAIKTNKLLIEKGLQIKNPNKKSKKDATYLATDKGREYSDLTLATVEGKTDTAQQLRWYDCTASLL